MRLGLGLEKGKPCKKNQSRNTPFLAAKRTYRSRTEQVKVENIVHRPRPVGYYEELVQVIVCRRVGFNVTKHPSEVRNGGSRRKYIHKTHT